FTNTSTIDPFLKNPQDNLKYIGFEKSNDIQENLKFYIIIFLILTFQKIVKLKQKHYRFKEKKIQPFYSILYEDITWVDMDKDFIQFFKYMTNFCFYRFGLEICFFVSTIVIITRMDAYAILYGIWLGLFLNMKRITISKIWTVYFLFLIVLLPIQYIGCLGLPPVFCYTYPWSQHNAQNPFNLYYRFRMWLFLPDYSNPPPSNKLLADFFQVFFVWLQLHVFNLELNKNSKIPVDVIERIGGKNNELVYETKNPLNANPFHDFISKTRNYLDKFKYGIFMYSYWMVLAIVFLTGTSRISVLCMGYVILSFIFLWMGQSFLTRPLEKLLKFWNILVFYCFMVIFIKAILQIVLCIFSSEISPRIICILIDIFGIDCRALPADDKFPRNTCTKDGSSEEVGLVWDVVCFLVLLLQKRLYMSYMFEHVVNEYRAQSLLAARGAEIFKKIISHKVAKEKEKENKILEKLKENVERIRKHQTTEASQEPQDHYSAVRSGDYYMFDEEFDIEETEDMDLNDESEKPKRKKSEDESLQSSTSSSHFSSELKKAILSTAVILNKTDLNLEKLKEIDKKQSWLTIENKKLLMLKFYLEKYFLIIFDYAIFYIDKHSKDFRLVSHMLIKEKFKLKLNTNNLTPSLQSADGSVTDQDILQSLEELNQYMNSQSRFDKFLSSIFYFALSQSEFICYFFMILNHLKSASLLSVPLPISIFLWAMLCLPRPTKTFWITSITYIETIVVIKYLFQFKFWMEWEMHGDTRRNIFSLFGIEKQDNFAVYDLFALLVIFLHRTILKRLGLWKDYSGDEEDEEMITLSKKEENPLEDLEKSVDSKDENKFEENDDVEAQVTQEINESDLKDEQIEDEENYENDLNGFKAKVDLIKKQKTTNPFLKFYRDIESKHYAVVVDCYAKIFLCDFINCIITIFTYQYFGELAYLSANDSASNVVSSIKENKVPYSFLILFLIQFILMIVDRALYLRKNRVGKFIFQLILVLFVHIWVFFVLPYITKLKFVDNKAVQIWYFVRCIYFGYSSRQIRCGYPTRILGNFLTKSYSYVNLVLFKGFLLVPFLLELRSLMDWMFTDTSLSLSDWLQMEDIYANIFVLKCFRYNENKYPTPRGTKRKAIIKYGFGGILLTAIILIIWFPLLLFSVSEGFNRTVPPQACKVDLQISGFLQIYSMSSQQRNAQKYTKQDYEKLKLEIPQAYTFLKDYSPEDIYCISIPGNSTSIWQISPPSFKNLKDQLNEPDPVELNFFYSINRESTGMKNEQLSEMVSASKQTLLYNETKRELYHLLNNDGVQSVDIKAVYPRFIHARPKGNIIEIESMKNSSNATKYYVDVRITLRNESNNLWWDADDITNEKFKPPCYKKGFLSIVVFSDKISPSSISFITEQGIIGIYITFVLALSRFIRIMLVNSSMKIMFEQLPNVDKILKLVKSVYMVRENKQFLLEEELFAKIVFLYRSPETMIKYTRPPNPNKFQSQNLNPGDKKNL
ncbi:unnamed protein product, partial [Brachionus calyciflorus]